MQKSYDLLIIGGGPAGISLGKILAQENQAQTDGGQEDPPSPWRPGGQR
ncbi:MAG TPA: hypothetical protein PKW24_02985 [Clostridiales bacterium]|jgi:cation diffusion facilitator CzcD-associated flavoprotein CzcO|nr:hypothetical protein [Clostridiales bacterium]